MSFRVHVGPPQVTIHQGQTVLITEEDGQVIPPSQKGLYFLDTRMLSAWAIYANGEPWRLLNGGAMTYYAASVFLTNGDFLTRGGTVAPRTLSLVISRAIDGGMHEDIDIINYGSAMVSFNLEIAIRCDFADVAEVKAEKIVRRGRIHTHWDATLQALCNSYRNEDFFRSVTITSSGTDALYANGRISYEIELQPGARWHGCLLYDLADGKTPVNAPMDCVAEHAEGRQAAVLREWREGVLNITTSNEEFYRFYHQAVEDMASLRLPSMSSHALVFMPAAGLPWFMAPFGRDSLIASLQNILIHAGFAHGTLEILAGLQATERDDYRDAEPGKIMHELRCGELAHFKLIPHTPYYGTADATPLWLITLHAAWRATGDRGLLVRHLKTAEACLAWIDEFGDRDGDGFQEYQTRSVAGYENMGWKDSGDAVMHADGGRANGPKALCELQGYVYDAWQRMAQIYLELGDEARAKQLRAKAQALFTNFNAAFWDEEGGYYAFALDGNKNQVLSVTSNPGHCLWSGIVPRDRAGRLVKRLMAPDMWSGWGIRTLSSSHKSFNPYAYQLGSVWPHDNALIALGFKRYGFHDEAAQVARAISGAAGYFQGNQLPELYAGTRKEEDSFPVQYVGANVPQAWSAGSAFGLLKAMLGLAPDASRNRLYVDPALPGWLPDVTLSNLKIGKNSLSVRFWLEGTETSYEVLAGDASIIERRPFGEAWEAARPGLACT